MDQIMLFSRQGPVRLANDVAVLCPDNRARPIDPNRDLSPFADLSDLIGIITERILTPQLFCNAGKRCLKIVQRIGFKFSSAAVLRQSFEIFLTGLVLFGRAAGSPTSSSTAAVYRSGKISAGYDRTKNIAPAAAAAA